MITRPDNADPGMWYYLGIQEATNDHSYERTAQGREKRTQLLPTTYGAGLEL